MTAIRRLDPAASSSSIDADLEYLPLSERTFPQRHAATSRMVHWRFPFQEKRSTLPCATLCTA